MRSFESMYFTTRDVYRFLSDQEFRDLINCEIPATPEVEVREKAECRKFSPRKPNTCAKTLDNSAGKSV